jgi:hypothetical protein
VNPSIESYTLAARKGVSPDFHGSLCPALFFHRARVSVCRAPNTIPENNGLVRKTGMNPLEAIAHWLDDQDENAQHQIANSVAPYLLDDLSHAPRAHLFDDVSQAICLPVLQEWLSEDDLTTYQIMGRAVRFRACFEFAFRERLAGDASPHGREVGLKSAWGPLVETHISDAALKEWSLDQLV